MGYILIIFKWLALIPVSLASSLLAWLVSPIAPLFVNRKTWRLPSWLAWCSTPTTWLRGDRRHMAKYGDDGDTSDSSMSFKRYRQCTHWILRNPAVQFQRYGFIGLQPKDSDEYALYGDKECHNLARTGCFLGVLRTNGKARGWHFYACVRYPRISGKGLRVCLGWKLWEYGQMPAQHTCRITILKTLD